MKPLFFFAQISLYILVYTASGFAQAGSFDLSFGNNGRVDLPGGQINPANNYQMATTADGKIFTFGYFKKSLGALTPVFMRFTQDGKGDASFGQGGVIEASMEIFGVRPDGKQIVTYESTKGLVRFREDGSRDTTLINSIFSLGLFASDVIVYPNGNILIGASQSNKFILRNFLPDGTKNPGFNAGAGQNTVILNATSAKLCNLLFPGDGKILAVGQHVMIKDTQAVVVRYHPDGILDTTFGTNGVRLTPMGSQRAKPIGAVLQEDGKLIIAGNSPAGIVVLRLLPDGSPDSTFGINGFTNFDLLPGPDEQATAIGIQPNGNIVVAGNTAKTEGQAFRIRFDAKGQPDNTFNAGAILANWRAYKTGVDLSVLADGKLIISIVALSNRLAVIRLDDQGNPDISFGENGIAPAPFISDHEPIRMFILPDDKIITVSIFDRAVSTPSFQLNRFLPDGQADTSFGVNGRTTILFEPAGGNIHISAALLPGGKIVVVYKWDTSGKPFAVAHCFNPNGSLDNTFGNGGKLNVPGNYLSLYDIAAQADGKIILVGATLPSTQYLTAIRLLPNGSIDNSFATNGQFTLIIPPNNLQSYASAVQVRPDGKIIIMGRSTQVSASNVIILAQLNPDGSLDNSFGTGGVYSKPFIYLTYPTYYLPYFKNIIFDKDGNLYHAGRIKPASNSGVHLGVSRHLYDGFPDYSYGNSGMISAAILSNNYFKDIAIQPDGKLLLAGLCYPGAGEEVHGSEYHAFLFRFNPNGDRDSSFGKNGLVSAYYDQSGFSSFDCIGTQSDGKIIVAGMHFDGLFNHFSLARLHASENVGTATPPTRLTGLSVYPNPAANDIQIAFSLTESGNYSMRLLDVLGNVVLHLGQRPYQAGPNLIRAEIDELKPGTYFVEILGEGSLKSVPFIKTR